MYEVMLSTYVENEKTCEKDAWIVADEFGSYRNLDAASGTAELLAAYYRGFVEVYCLTHQCDGISLDVVDATTSLVVAAYDVSAAGNVTMWHDEECHEWKVI